ncbi:cyclic GMP-AMP synthase-like [Mytilus californianus]|uniref:cyclic GMP-AMP synthase-like n=1 Tax=Mytilus californianus TaxID=6549 RepID=UPI0022483AE5|nr:cyclic GMP-AMP synthase-like [Mytilus californianus]
MSFSVGEKFLINTFTHTQLLCYVLLKILLKNSINIDSGCKELLCSYHMKTVLFWVSEELPLSEWRPENLTSCFMRCLRRLIYFVEYSMCPHYFIPENNLFENKMNGQSREILLNKLYIFNSYGWQCIACSENSPLKGVSYNILGIAFQLMGDKESAKQAFMQSMRLYPYREYNTAYLRLSLIC